MLSARPWTRAVSRVRCEEQSCCEHAHGSLSAHVSSLSGSPRGWDAGRCPRTFQEAPTGLSRALRPSHRQESSAADAHCHASFCISAVSLCRVVLSPCGFDLCFLVTKVVRCPSGARYCMTFVRIPCRFLSGCLSHRRSVVQLPVIYSGCKSFVGRCLAGVFCCSAACFLIYLTASFKSRSE